MNRLPVETFRLATVEQILARNPQASRAAVETLLPGLQRAIFETVEHGQVDAGLIDLNRPIMDFQPMTALLTWFVPELVNAALIDCVAEKSNGGDGGRSLHVVLFMQGLLADEQDPPYPPSGQRTQETLMGLAKMINIRRRS